VAKVCEPCRYYNADDASQLCPGCGAALRITFLPPPDEPMPGRPQTAGAPILGVPAGRGPVPSLGSRVLTWVTGTPLGLAVLAISAVLLLGSVWEWIKHDPTSDADSTGRIRVGMTMSDVAQEIEPEPPAAPGLPHLTETFPPGNTRNGDLVWRENGRWVRITFSNGRVTGVREEPAGNHGFGNTGRQITMNLD
jgi:hypothetical protein